jgi:hypothetical protein
MTFDRSGIIRRELLLYSVHVLLLIKNGTNIKILKKKIIYTKTESIYMKLRNLKTVYSFPYQLNIVN